MERKCSKIESLTRAMTITSIVWVIMEMVLSFFYHWHKFNICSISTAVILLLFTINQFKNIKH